MSTVKQIGESILNGDHIKTVELTKQAISEGIDPNEIIDKGFIAAMSVVGEKYKNNEIFVPEMLIAARAMKAGLEVIRSQVVSDKIKPLATLVLGTVKGDLHDIGKNLIGMMMEGAGLQVIDLGVDVAPEQFVEAVKTYRPYFLGMSTLLTTTMPAAQSTIDHLLEAGIRKEVKVLVGGAPVTPKFAHQIGADGYAPNAGAAVDTVRALMK